MNTNQNRDIANNLINDFDLSEFRDIIPQKVIPSIQPVHEVYEKIAIPLGSINGSTTGGGATAFTSQADRDTYITGITYSFCKDASCDQADGSQVVNFTVNGVTVTVALCDTITLTAQNSSGSIVFNPPLKIDRNTNATVTARSFTAGKLRQRINIFGFIKNNRNNTGS